MHKVYIFMYSCTFQVHHCDYAAADYSILVSNKSHIRRVPPADVKAIRLQEEEEALLAAEAAAEAEEGISDMERLKKQRDLFVELQQAVADDFSEISARWGLATWRSISIKAFAEGYYGSTTFLGPLAAEIKVTDKSFQQAMEKELCVKPMHLFSRHKGQLQAKIADLANSQKLIAVGTSQWDVNKMFSVPGGSTKILGVIKETRARVEEEVRALTQASANGGFVGEEGLDDGDDDELAQGHGKGRRLLKCLNNMSPDPLSKNAGGDGQLSPLAGQRSSTGEEEVVSLGVGEEGSYDTVVSAFGHPESSFVAPGKSLIGKYRGTMEENESFAEASLKVSFFPPRPPLFLFCCLKRDGKSSPGAGGVHAVRLRGPCGNMTFICPLLNEDDSRNPRVVCLRLCTPLWNTP